MKKRIISFMLCLVLSLGTFTVMANAASGTINTVYDYWTNKETLQLHYTGYIQFMPAYVSTGKYGLAAGKQVKQAYINYSRNGESVIGGRQYTAKASNKYSTKIYYAEASCWDSLNPFAAKTKFNYGWIKF